MAKRLICCQGRGPYNIPNSCDEKFPIQDGFAPVCPKCGRWSEVSDPFELELDKWDYRFFETAARNASWSKDRTKVGACLVRPDKTIASSGFNGLVPGMDDDLYLKDRDFKNMIVLHAEENAILHCRDSNMDGFSMYVWGLTPCGHCASVMSMKGIKKVLAVSSQVSTDWNASCEAAKTVFAATGMEFMDCTSEYFFQGKRIQ